MLKFLDDFEMLTATASLLENAKTADLAVAYWGLNAVEMLGIDKSKTMRIMCDLLSGGCNPHEIAKLRAFAKPKGSSGVEVRHLDGLHAKVYATATQAIVGSANASANGLGDEGAPGTIEAALLTDDLATLASIKMWFDKKWEHAQPIDAPMMKRAKDAWLRCPPKANPKDTVLDVYLSNPGWFRSRVWVTYYFSDASPASKKKFDEVKKLHYSAAQIKNFDAQDMPMYDLDNSVISRENIGDYIIDAPSDGALQIIEVVPYSRKYCVVLVKPRSDICGLRFPKKERVLIRKAIERHLDVLEKKAGRALTDQEKDFGCALEEFGESAPVAQSYLVQMFLPPEKLKS